MEGGLTTSFVMELPVYPAVYLLWKWNTEMKHLPSAPTSGLKLLVPYEAPSA
jgi:hypothetical protein